MAQKPDGRLKPVHPMVVGLLSLLLLLACFVFAVSFYASLFGGPAWLWVVTMLSVLLACAALFLVVTGRRPADPRGLSGPCPWLTILDVPLTRIGQVAATALLVSVPTLFFSSGYFCDGLIETGNPILTPREEYRLVNHGRVTEVSRLRFLIAGISGTIAMHGMFLFVALFPLNTFLFGDRFHLLKVTDAQSKSAEPAAAADGGHDPDFSESSVAQRGRRRPGFWDFTSHRDGGRC